MVAAELATSSRGERRVWQQSWSRNSAPSEGGREGTEGEVISSTYYLREGESFPCVIV